MSIYQYRAGELSEDPTIIFPNGEEVGDVFEITLELNKLHEWIKQAAPLLSHAACIVIDEAIDRLGEIEGIRGVVETCPIEFTHLPSSTDH